jgi:hypothetical protein
MPAGTLRSSRPLPAALADELQRILVERIRNTGYVAMNDADLARIVTDIRAWYRTQGGGRVLLVPHSQGALYANAAYARLTQPAADGKPTIEPKSLGIVAVATPAAYVAGGNSRYVNSRQDLVLYGLRKLLGNASVLAGNVSQPVTLDDPLGHNFQPIYLRAGTQAMSKVLGDIAAVFDALVGLEYEGLGPPFWSGVAAEVMWRPAVPASGPRCESPSRLVWVDTWSNPNLWRSETRLGVEVTELARQAKANAAAAYESGLRRYRDYLLNRPGAPIPNGPISAWWAYSADSQWVYYEEQALGPGQVEYVQCPNDSRTWQVAIDGSRWGRAHILGRCGK